MLTINLNEHVSPCLVCVDHKRGFHLLYSMMKSDALSMDLFLSTLDNVDDWHTWMRTFEMLNSIFKTAIPVAVPFWWFIMGIFCYYTMGEVKIRVVEGVWC
jgi:hypothetical protein